MRFGTKLMIVGVILFMIALMIGLFAWYHSDDFSAFNVFSICFSGFGAGTTAGAGLMRNAQN